MLLSMATNPTKEEYYFMSHEGREIREVSYEEFLKFVEGRECDYKLGENGSRIKVPKNPKLNHLYASLYLEQYENASSYEEKYNIARNVRHANYQTLLKRLKPKKKKEKLIIIE